ncbi:MAG: NAD+ synthase [Rikenellaceae bacterium]
MNIALAQLNYIVGDVEGNTFKIIDSIKRAKADGADLVVFAEQSISGLPAYDLLHKNTFLELCEDALVQIAFQCDGIAAIVGLPILTNNGTISAAALIQDRKVLRYVGKRNITARREMGFMTGGAGCEYATIAGHRCAIVVGDDLSQLRDFDNSIETIISVNARKYGIGIFASRFENMRNIAYVEGKNIVMINQVGGGSDIIYDGTSAIFNKRGELVLRMKSFEEDYELFDLSEDIYGAPCAPLLTHTDRTRVLYGAAKLGLKDFFEKSGYTKACIGLSGGVDSSVVASIAVDALGAENVMGLMMPSEFSEENAVEDAVQLAKNLGIDYNIIPIDGCYHSVVNSLSSIIGGTEFDATEENILSRIRTTLLMALQNKRGHVLLNSSNKSENALGLCTLYGDTAGALSVTGDLYKSEIYDIAKHINKLMGDVIPESILNKTPSSEVRPDRRDAHSLPPYEVVDVIVYRMIEKGEHREEIVNAGFDSEHVELIHKMIMQSEKKRFQYPPVLRLSQCTFGHERIMPITHKYGD